MNTLRAHIVDTDVTRRASLSRAFYDLGGHPEFYDDISEFDANVRSPGLVFVERHSGLNSIIERVADNNSPFNGCPFIVYAEGSNSDDVVQAMLAGAIDYLDWPMPLNEFEQRLKLICERAIPRQEFENRRYHAIKKVAKLSRRESQVLQFMIEGLGNKAIAQRLGISHRTVEIHRLNMLKKIGAVSSSSAVRIGIYAGLDRVDQTAVALPEFAIAIGL